MEENFGVINQAFSVSRTELILWFNTTLKLRMHCIEQLGTGAAHVQMFDYYFPGSVKIAKVKWDARNSWGFVENYKLLQQGFDNLGLKKMIDIDRLKNAKYQDNLEFAQWMMHFCNVNVGEPRTDAYNGVAVRNKKQLVYLDNPNKVRSFQNVAKKHKASQIKKKEAESQELIRKNSRKRGSALAKKKPGIAKKKPIHPKNSSSYKKSKSGGSGESGYTNRRMTNLNRSKPKLKTKPKKKSSSEAIKDIDFVLDTLKSATSDSEKVRELKKHFGLSEAPAPVPVPLIAPTPTPQPIQEEEDEEEEDVVEEAEVDDLSSDDDN